MKNTTQKTVENRNGLLQLIRVGNSILLKWVKPRRLMSPAAQFMLTIQLIFMLSATVCTLIRLLQMEPANLGPHFTISLSNVFNNTGHCRRLYFMVAIQL